MSESGVDDDVPDDSASGADGRTPFDVFDVAARAGDLDGPARDAFIERECGRDAGRADQVRALLQVDVPTGFLRPRDVEERDELDPPLSGTRLGDFELCEVLGRGGMGVVYRALQHGLDREVAVKVLPSFRRDDRVAFERFQREASAVSRLSHEAVVGVLATGETEQLCWLAMPLVKGHDLGQETRLQRAGDSSLTLLPRFGSERYVSTVLGGIAGVADGLEHAHGRGVLHRDVKPSNVMLDRRGRFILLDFGLARVAGTGTLTKSDDVQGTPHYMSPEQSRAIRGPIGPRADVYSLGVVLFELLAGQRPFVGEDARDVLRQIASGTHLDLRRVNPRIPRDLAVVCQKAMSHRPRDRYECAAEFRDDLRRFLAREAVVARPPTLAQRLLRWARRHPWHVVVPGVAVALVAAWMVSGEAAARHALRATRVTPLRQVVSSESPSNRDLAAAFTVLRDTDVAQSPDPEIRRVAEEARGVVEADIAARIGEINAVMANGLGQRTAPRFGPDVVIEPDFGQLLDGVRKAAESSSMYLGHEELARLEAIEKALPRVDAEIGAGILGSTEGALIAQARDVATDELQDSRVLSPLPATQIRLSPGTYRFTAVLDDGRFAELDRVLDLSSGTTSLTFWPRSEQEIARHAVLLQPLERRFPPADQRPFGCVVPRGHVPLHEYWIDRCELSNERVLQYMRATGSAAPTAWLDKGFDGRTEWFPAGDATVSKEEWLARPAIQLTYPELRACAEWYGCRIATHRELEYAHRGPLMLKGTEPNRGVEDNVRGTRVVRDLYWEAAAQLWSVSDPRALDPRTGLFHCFGNVCEITSTRVAYLPPGGRGVLRTIPYVHVVLGESWTALSTGKDLTEHSTLRADAFNISHRIGARLARSVRPPRTD